MTDRSSITYSLCVDALPESPTNLLEYVLRSDPNGSLDGLADRCKKGLQQINPEMLAQVRNSVDELVSRVEKPHFKQIRGESTWDAHRGVLFSRRG